MTLAAIITFFNNYKYPILSVLVFVILGCFGGYGYYLYNSNNKLQKQVYILENELVEQQEYIQILNRNVQGINKAKESILYTLRKQDKDYKAFRETLYREIYKEKKSLEELSKKKTKLVENIINKATTKAVKDLEEIAK